MIWQITFYKDAAYKIVQIQHGFTHKFISAETQINRVMSHKVSLWSMFLFEGEKSILHKETVFSWPHVTKPSDANMKRQWGKTHLSVWYLGSLYQDNTPEQKKIKCIQSAIFTCQRYNEQQVKRILRFILQLTVNCIQSFLWAVVT